MQTTLLVPAFVLAEATLSFVGLGFSEPTPSWGGMLRDAGRGRALFDAPWLLAPAVAIVLLTLAVNLIAGAHPCRRSPVGPFMAVKLLILLALPVLREVFQTCTRVSF